MSLVYNEKIMLSMNVRAFGRANCDVQKAGLDKRLEKIPPKKAGKKIVLTKKKVRAKNPSQTIIY
jgi:hypothetical protein